VYCEAITCIFETETIQEMVGTDHCEKCSGDHASGVAVVKTT